MRKWKWLNTKWAKPAIITGIALVVVAGCVIGYTAYASNGTVTTTTTFIKTKAETGNISTSVSGSGTVSSSGEYALTAAGSGTVDTLNVKQGDSVTAGQVIAHVTSASDQQTVTQKQNALTTAQNNLTQAQQSLSSGQYIKSPIAGRVKSVTVSAGDDLSVTKSVGSLMVISTDGKMDVSLSSNTGLTSGTVVNVAVTTYDGSTVNVTGTITTSTSSGTAASGDGKSGGSSSSSLVAQIGRDDLPVGAAAVVTYNGQTIGSGSLALDSTVAISNSGNGTVTKVNVAENSTVSKGSNLVTLNSTSLQNAVTSAQQQVTNAQADLATAQAQLDKATVTSPVDGVVASVSTSTGASVQNGGAIATILQNNAMQTVVTVDETDIAKIKVGQSAQITLDAVSGKTFTGKVTAVDVMGTTSNGVTNFNVTVSIENPTGILVGETTNVSLITEEKDNTIVLSANAVLEKRGTSAYVLDASKLFDSNGKSVTLDNMTTSELVQKYGKKVTIGLSTSKQVEITSGLSAGDEVATAVTINKSAVKSLSASRSSSSSSFGFGGGMGGETGGNFGGGNYAGGYTGGGTRTNRTGGTGNTTSKG